MDDIEFLNLDKVELNNIEQNNCNRKKFNKILYDSKKNNENKCLICGKEIDGFCNSHTIPQFVLKNIANNGELYCSNKITKLPFLNDNLGIKNAGTFRLVCKNCDNESFQTYENPNNYDNISGKMLAEIAMKNYLYEIYTLKNLIKITDEYIDKFGKVSYELVNIMEKFRDVKKKDLDELEFYFSIAKKAAKKDNSDEYYLFEKIPLNYTVPIAIQVAIPLIVDLEGRVINNIYDERKKRIVYMHLCVFPFKNKTEILMFVEKKFSKTYRPFYRSLKKLLIDDKLSIINYIIFLYTDNYFISKKLNDEILKDKNLKNISSQLFQAYSDSNFEKKEIVKFVGEKFSLSRHNQIPNVLNKEYCVHLVN